MVASVISKHINKKKLEHSWINLAEEIKDNMVTQQLTGSPVIGVDKGDVSFQRLSGLQPLLKNEANSLIFCYPPFIPLKSHEGARECKSSHT